MTRGFVIGNAAALSHPDTGEARAVFLLPASMDYTFVSQFSGDGPKRRRLAKACETCRSRKVSLNIEDTYAKGKLTCFQSETMCAFCYWKECNKPEPGRFTYY